MSALATEALGKSYGERTIFADVSIEVQPGEALAVMGPSGTGKTTLLRCLNGLERAERGVVNVGTARLCPTDGPRARAAAVRALRQQVGLVFQGCHLFSHRTVLENVMEGPVFVRREPAALARTRALGLLERLGVHHRAAAYPRELSGGEQQRTAIARALALDPAVLLLDEPTSALDEMRGERLAAMLRELQQEGLAIVTATHDAAFASALAARVVHLDASHEP